MMILLLKITLPREGTETANKDIVVECSYN